MSGVRIKNSAVGTGARNTATTNNYYYGNAAAASVPVAPQPQPQPEPQQARASSVPSAQSGEIQYDYDVFVSHAHEDKNFVHDLCVLLKNNNIRVWYDKFSIKWGDSLMGKIEDGIRRSRFGIVVISEIFLKKYWTEYERQGIMARQNRTGEKVMLPIVHGMNHEELVAINPALSGFSYLRSSEGHQVILENLLGIING